MVRLDLGTLRRPAWLMADALAISSWLRAAAYCVEVTGRSEIGGGRTWSEAIWLGATTLTMAGIAAAIAAGLCRWEDDSLVVLGLAEVAIDPVVIPSESDEERKRRLAAQRAANHRARQRNARVTLVTPNVTQESVTERDGQRDAVATPAETHGIPEVTERDASRVTERDGISGGGMISSPSGSGSLFLLGDPDPDLTPARGGYPPAFEEVWRLYPKKVSKGAALRKWRKQRPPADAIKAALAWQVLSYDWTKDGGAFIPHFASYIEDRRWDDEPTTHGSGGARASPQANLRIGHARAEVKPRPTGEVKL